MNIKEYYLLVLFVCEKVDKLELTAVDVLFILAAILVDVIVCCELIY